jgi:putative tricarboxylic transport membrane protein
MSQGSPLIFFTRPIASAFMILAFLSIGWGIWLQIKSGGPDVVGESDD